MCGSEAGGSGRASITALGVSMIAAAGSAAGSWAAGSWTVAGSGFRQGTLFPQVSLARQGFLAVHPLPKAGNSLPAAREALPARTRPEQPRCNPTPDQNYRAAEVRIRSRPHPLNRPAEGVLRPGVAGERPSALRAPLVQAWQADRLRFLNAWPGTGRAGRFTDLERLDLRISRFSIWLPWRIGSLAPPP